MDGQAVASTGGAVHQTAWTVTCAMGAQRYDSYMTGSYLTYSNYFILFRKLVKI